MRFIHFTAPWGPSVGRMKMGTLDKSDKLKTDPPRIRGRFPVALFPSPVKATAESEKEGALPDAQLMAEMGKYNEELTKAGILLAADGLQPSSKGARVKFFRKCASM